MIVLILLAELVIACALPPFIFMCIAFGNGHTPSSARFENVALLIAAVPLLLWIASLIKILFVDKTALLPFLPWLGLAVLSAFLAWGTLIAKEYYAARLRKASVPIETPVDTAEEPPSSY